MSSFPDQAPTDPTGRTFISYRRSRLAEVERLVRALREVGVPTWRDVDDLAHAPTGEELERTLADPATASAVLWLTPEVADSPTIRNLEAPRIVERAARGDGFYAVPVAAGGLGYEEAGALVRDRLGVHDLGGWNLLRMEGDPAGDDELREVARRVLDHRVRAVCAAEAPEEPFRLRIRNWTGADPHAGFGLSLDWSHCFGERYCRDPSDWEKVLLPALRAVKGALDRHARVRTVEASGRPSLSTAFVLGRAFLAVGELRLAWRQEPANQRWTLSAEPGDQPLEVSIRAARPDGEALAVLLSLVDDVETGFGATAAELPTFSAHVRIRPPGAFERSTLGTPGEALAVAQATIAAVRRARCVYPAKEIHLFAAIPAGLAVLLGQLANTLPAVHVHEHDPATGRYRPGVVLRAREEGDRT